MEGSVCMLSLKLIEHFQRLIQACGPISITQYSELAEENSNALRKVKLTFTANPSVLSSNAFHSVDFNAHIGNDAVWCMERYGWSTRRC